MVKSRTGKKHLLLFYYQTMTRIWKRLLAFALVLWGAWWFAPSLPSFQPPKDEIIYYAGVAVTSIMVIIFLMRRGATIRAEQDHLIIAVPFYRLKIPYSYVKSMRITDLKHALNGVSLKKGDKKFVRRYAGDTPVSALILKEMPKPIGVLHLFFPKYMFLAEGRGMFFLLEDIMGFNAEFESQFNSSRTIEEMSA